MSDREAERIETARVALVAAQTLNEGVGMLCRRAGLPASKLVEQAAALLRQAAELSSPEFRAAREALP